MKIAVNARMLTQWKPGGIRRYARETLKRITERHREHDFLFIVDRPFHERGTYPDNVIVERAFPSFHPLLWYPWFEFAVPQILKRHKADLFLSPDGFVCLSTDVPTVAVIHDLNFHHSPGFLPFLHSRYLNRFFPKFAKKATAIVTVSEYSKRDIANLYGEQPDGITVTYNGVGEAFRPLSEEARSEVRQELTGGSPYLLSVGALHPRKNVARLLEAFEKFKKGDSSGTTKLVLVGPWLFKTNEAIRVWQRMSHKNDVLFVDPVPDEQLMRIYGGAHAFVFVSCFEGFGIPPLEAMGCDVPVVAADTTSLPEVCGNAARYVNPFSVDAIAEGMRAVCTDETLRRTLIERGRTQKSRFSWDRTADLLWGAVERSLP